MDQHIYKDKSKKKKKKNTFPDYDKVEWNEKSVRKISLENL